MPCTFDRAHWLHFDDDYCALERMVIATGHRLFTNARHEPGGWHRLLASGLIAGIDEMSTGTAAALGWSGSWIGAARTLSPSCTPTGPAFGLTLWLANLPIRPAYTSPQDWHVTISRWLMEDLCLTASVWMDIAHFMRAQGTYLLHGTIVDVRELARRHRPASRDGGSKVTSIIF